MTQIILHKVRVRLREAKSSRNWSEPTYGGQETKEKTVKTKAPKAEKSSPVRSVRRRR